jgi:hypothetical protein
MRLRRSVVLTVAACGVLLMSSIPATAASVPQKHQPAVAPVITGNDISWPQCIRVNPLPSSQAFAIVGVNNGTSDSTNPCFTSELAWAKKSSGATGQPRVSLYVNTANPGDVASTVTDWPTSNFGITEPNVPDIDPYGTCRGADDTACSWQYGYNMADLDVTTRGVPTPSNYHWYLDIETVNKWTSSTARNVADLEGMVTYFKSIGVTVGLYSTYRQWQDIVGDTYGKPKDAASNILEALPSWVPDANDGSSAEAGCKLQPFTAGGAVALSQYLSIEDDLDFDVSCT